MKCPSCEVLYINGTKCHESKCPESWKDYTKECKECGSPFIPEEKFQTCCSPGCHYAHYGLPSDYEEE